MSLRLLVALDCEAKPLLAHYRLKRDRAARGFSVYRSADDSVALIVSGIGAAAAAAATAYLHAYLHDSTNHAWLNVGVAGHGDHALSTLVLAHTVIDANSGKRWYPPPVLALDASWPLVRTALSSVAVPMTNYPEDCAYDMEAAGFYPTACRFSSAELVQVVKIISDNRSTSVEQVTAAAVEQHLAAQLPILAELGARLTALADELLALEHPPAELAAIPSRWRFSATEQRQLTDRLRRWRHLSADPLPPLTEFTNGQALLHWLEQRLAEISVR